MRKNRKVSVNKSALQNRNHKKKKYKVTQIPLDKYKSLWPLRRLTDVKIRGTIRDRTVLGPCLICYHPSRRFLPPPSTCFHPSRQFLAPLSPVSIPPDSSGPHPHLFPSPQTILAPTLSCSHPPRQFWPPPSPVSIPPDSSGPHPHLFPSLQTVLAPTLTCSHPPRQF
jgi:hypothetical protein